MPASSTVQSLKHLLAMQMFGCVLLSQCRPLQLLCTVTLIVLILAAFLAETTITKFSV